MTNALEPNQSGTTDGESRGRLPLGLDTAGVYGLWQKALELRHTDPPGAIASARDLLERVCRLVLDDRDIAYSEALDLPVLMKMMVEQLNFAPAGASQTTFKRMLGSADSEIGHPSPPPTGLVRSPTLA